MPRSSDSSWRPTVGALLALGGGLFLAFVAWDVGWYVWNICHADEVVPGLSAQNCFEDTGIVFNFKRWLLYTACAGAVLGAGALASSWLLFRGKGAGRILWLTLCLLAALYFLVFWGYSGRILWTGLSYAGIYMLVFIVSFVVVPKPAAARLTPSSSA